MCIRDSNQSGDADLTSKNNEEFVSAQMAKMKKTYVDKGIPVIDRKSVV